MSKIKKELLLYLCLVVGSLTLVVGIIGLFAFHPTISDSVALMGETQYLELLFKDSLFYVAVLNTYIYPFLIMLIGCTAGYCTVQLLSRKNPVLSLVVFSFLAVLMLLFIFFSQGIAGLLLTDEFSAKLLLSFAYLGSAFCCFTCSYGTHLFCETNCKGYRWILVSVTGLFLAAVFSGFYRHNLIGLLSPTQVSFAQTLFNPLMLIDFVICLFFAGLCSFIIWWINQGILRHQRKLERPNQKMTDAVSYRTDDM